MKILGSPNEYHATYYIPYSNKNEPSFYLPFSSIRYVQTQHTRAQTYIPLQSFNLESPLLTTIGGNKKPPAELLLKKYTKPSLNANESADTMKTDENFPVLKIEEDLDGITMTGCKTTSTSTQTSPIQEVANKKGSTSTIWTSEESILRSADTVDEDNKSTSSSACEETGVAMSSDKSGELLYFYIYFFFFFHSLSILHLICNKCLT